MKTAVVIRNCIVVLLLVGFAGAHAQTDNRRLVHQGRILRPDGSALEGSFQMEAKIYSPGPSRCLLWGESKSVNFSRGAFNFELGDAIYRISGNNGGRALNFSSTFINNPSLAVTSASCESGTTYTPQIHDGRLMVITLLDGPQTIKVYEGPIRSVPYALDASNATMVGGYSSEFILKASPVSAHKPSRTFSTLGASLLWEFAENGRAQVVDPVDPTDAVNLQSMNAAISAAVTGGTSGVGSVTHVNAVSASTGVMNISGGPITSQGTFNFSFVPQLANTVFAAPPGGGVPSFRVLAADDIPSLDTSKITSGTLGIQYGGTGLGTLAPHGILAVNGFGTAIEQRTCAVGEVLVWAGATGWECQVKSSGASDITTGTLGTAFGGTGLNASAAAPGEILIGTGSGFVLNTLTAGSGIAIGNAAGTISISATVSSIDASAITSGTLDVSRGGSQWSNVAQGIHYSSGSVGVGTNAPEEKLHVVSQVPDTGIMVEGNYNSGDSVNLNFYRSRGTASSKSTLNDGDEVWNILGQGYHAGGGYNYSSGIVSYVEGTPSGAEARAGIDFFTNNGTDFGSRMKISASGNIAIGHDNPRAILDLTSNGTLGSAIRIPQDTTALRPSAPELGMMRYNLDTNSYEVYEPTGWYSIRTASGTTGTSSQWTDVTHGIRYGAGSVSIGSSVDPTQALDLQVNQNANTAIRVANTNSGNAAEAGMIFENSAGEAGYLFSTSPNYAAITAYQNRFNLIATPATMGLTLGAENGDIHFLANGQIERMRINQNGLVGIGTQTPTAALDVTATGSLGSAIRIPRDTSGTRPVGSSAADLIGMMRYNTSDNVYEVYENGGWASLRTSSGTAGASQWANNSVGINYSSGSVGIGTATPTANLDVAGSVRAESATVHNAFGNAVISAQGTSISNGQGIVEVIAGNGGSEKVGAMKMALTEMTIGTGSQNGGAPLRFLTNNSVRMTVANDGRVGIGTLSPTSILDLSDVGGTFGSALRLPQESTALRPASPALGMIRYNTTDNKYEVYEITGWASLSTSSGSVATSQWNDNAYGINYLTGSVGIGTTSPEQKLHVVGSINSAGRFERTQNDDNLYGVLEIARSRSSATAPAAGFGSRLDFLTEGFTNNDLARTGSIVSGWENNQTNDTSDRDAFMAFRTMENNSTSSTGTERMRITSAGRVGIGTTTPLEVLDVRGNINLPHGSYITNNDPTFANSIMIGTYWDGSADHLTVQPVGNSTSRISFNTASTLANPATTKMSINSDGRVGIGTMSPSVALDIDVTGTIGSAIRIPRDSTVNRPANAGIGMIRYNTDDNKYEVYESTGWASLNTSSGTAGASQWQNTASGIYYSTGSVGVGGVPTNKFTAHWTAGDTTPTAYFGSNNASNLQNAIYAESNQNAAIVGTSNSGAGGAFYSSSGNGLYARSIGSAGLVATSESGWSGYFTSALATNTSPTLVVQQSGASVTDLQQWVGSDNIAKSRMTHDGRLALGHLGNPELDTHIYAERNSNVGIMIENQSASGNMGDALVRMRTRSGDYSIATNDDTDEFLLYDEAKTAERFRVNAQGFVGIGPSAAEVALDVQPAGTAGLAIRIPSGSATNRPLNPATGMMRYNSTANKYEVYETTGWASISTSSGSAAGDFRSDGSVPMTGQFLASSTLSTAGSPAISFAGDTNLGIYRNAADSMSFSANGNRQFIINDSGVEVEKTLTMTSTRGVVWGAGQQTGIYGVEGSTGLLSFSTNNTSRMRILSDGRVGIGTTTPSVALDIVGTGTLNSAIRIPRAAATMRPTGTIASELYGMMRYNTDDNKYEVYETTGWASLNTSSGTAGVSQWLNNSNGIHYNSGSIGIGIAVPTYRVDLRSTSTASQLHLSGTNADSGIYLTAYNANTGYMGAGVAYNGTNWEAKATEATLLAHENGTVRIYANDGLTAGTSFTPNPVFMMNSFGMGVKIGSAANPDSEFEVLSDRSYGTRGVLSSQYQNSDAGASVYLRKGRGSRTATTTVQPNDYIGEVHASAFDGTDFLDTASIEFRATAGVTTGSIPTSTIFYNNYNSTPVERMRVHHDGRVGIGTQSPTVALDVTATGTLGSAIRVPRASAAMRPRGSSAADLIGMIRYNTDSNKYEVYENTAWTALATSTGTSAGDFRADGTVPMTGQLRAATNLGGTPGFSFVGDPGTGIGGSGTQEMFFHVNNGTAAQLNVGGWHFYYDAHFGNGGSTSPAYPPISFFNDYDTGIYSPTGNTIGFATNATEKVRITSAGSLGIGITTPQSLVHMHGARSHLQFTNGTTGSGSASTGTQIGLYPDTGDFTLWNYYSSGAMFFGTNNLERMRLTSGGSLGIGTNAPGSVLHVTDGGTNPQITVGPSSQSNAYSTLSLRSKLSGALTEAKISANWAGEIQLSPQTNQNTVFYNNGTPVATVTNDARLGVGTVTPAVALDIVATDARSAIRIPQASTGMRPTSPTVGMMRYNTTDNKYEVYESTGWASLNTSSGTTGGGSSVWSTVLDGISYNGGNVIARGTFGVSPVIAASGAGARMMWYPRKAAFRAGAPEAFYPEVWDDTEIGNYSTAFGNSGAQGEGGTAFGISYADGYYSVAGGFRNISDSDYGTAFGYRSSTYGVSAIAMGYEVGAHGDNSIALGRKVNVGQTYGGVNGHNSMAIGLGIAAGTGPIVTGNQSLGIFMGDQSGANLTANNAMSLMGGSFGIGTLAPAEKLVVQDGRILAAGETIIAATTEGWHRAILNGKEHGYVALSNTGGVQTALIASSGPSYISSGSVGIGTTTPQSTLQVNGYIQLRNVAGAPPGADCDAAAEYGRMQVDATNSLMYVCTAAGWTAFNATGTSPHVTSCPSGYTMIGTAGLPSTYCISTTERTAANHLAAKLACNGISDASRGVAALCTNEQWYRACKAGTVTGMTGNYEWANNGHYNASGNFAATQGSSNCEDMDDDAVTSSRPYRCCFQ